MDVSTIKTICKNDPSLTPEEREKLDSLLNDDKFFDKLMQGAMGASVAYALAKFLKLGRTTQYILTAAGFGIGRILADRAKEYELKHPKQNGLTYTVKN